MLKYLLNFIWPQMRKITIITVGNNSYPATPKMIKAIARSMADTNTVIWNHTLDVRVVEIPYDKVSYFDSYENIRYTQETIAFLNKENK